MTVIEAADRLQQLLIDTGFDAGRPRPALAWAAFQRFAAEPTAIPTVELWFEAGGGDPATESPAYFDFVRVVRHDPDGEADWGEQITAHFTADPGVQLGLRDTVHAADVAHLPAWFAAVEASPSFQAGSAFTGWTFEVRIDGC